MDCYYCRKQRTSSGEKKSIWVVSFYINYSLLGKFELQTGPGNITSSKKTRSDSLPGPFDPPAGSLPSLKMTALSYSWTTCQHPASLCIEIRAIKYLSWGQVRARQENWRSGLPWSTRRGRRGEWWGPGAWRRRWGASRRGPARPPPPPRRRRPSCRPGGTRRTGWGGARCRPAGIRFSCWRHFVVFSLSVSKLLWHL